MSRTILLVEDNLSDEKLTRHAFKKGNVSNPILVARDGAEALDCLFQTSTRLPYDPTLLPAVVLLDLKVPVVSGFEILRRVRADQRTRQVPVVVLSASEEPRDISGSYLLGANAYLRKPVDLDELVEVVKAIGLSWLFSKPPPARERS
jgi:two-component system, response regulator